MTVLIISIIMTIFDVTARWPIVPDIGKFSRRKQRAIAATIHLVFVILIILLMIIMDSIQSTALMLFILIGQIYTSMVYSIIVHIVQRKIYQRKVVDAIKVLGLDSSSDAIAVRRRLMETSDKAYEVRDVEKALRQMYKEEMKSNSKITK